MSIIYSSFGSLFREICELKSKGLALMSGLRSSLHAWFIFIVWPPKTGSLFVEITLVHSIPLWGSDGGIDIYISQPNALDLLLKHVYIF
jgi:hypothetical protein